ncbi:MAG: hypothetical protein FJ275_05455 [Planctomycetes bacterium]|nr:hypothetical protein [Planctomycetota bacterium]
MRFVAGGDMLHDRSALDWMNLCTAKPEPDFALLGGDQAYDNGVVATSWIDWLGSWPKAGLAADRCLRSLVTVIGNQEVCGGHNARQVRDSTYFSTLLRRSGERSFCAVDVGTTCLWCWSTPGTRSLWLDCSRNGWRPRSHPARASDFFS